MNIPNEQDVAWAKHRAEAIFEETSKAPATYEDRIPIFNTMSNASISAYEQEMGKPPAFNLNGELFYQYSILLHALPKGDARNWNMLADLQARLDARIRANMAQDDVTPPPLSEAEPLLDSAVKRALSERQKKDTPAEDGGNQ